ncbi:hypothetical protein [Solibacillus isronensis]|uniref:hypothetical protein n=1 Tax=Solibacillus isronensis TaxID=412383 RepID=UPI0007FB4969|nr:hypothetical protein [Solibacillus silvestris]OBW54605.1 hypothetical protein A9986_13310 [Solibacillus silvestris]
MIPLYNQIDPLKYIKVLHRDTDGYVTFMRKFQHSDSVHQQHVYLDDITPEMIRSYVCYDSYISLNSFYRPLRRNNQLRTIHNFYIDIDCHNLGLKPEQVLEVLKADYFHSKLPEPNVILYSGRGFALEWHCEPLSGLAIDRWRKVQRKIFELLKNFGADPSSTSDAARVFRLPSSINSKSNEIVRYDYLHDRLMNLKTFSTYFSNNTDKKAVEQVNFAIQSNANSDSLDRPKKKLPKWFTVKSLLAGRLNDLETLIKLRKGNMKGHRERLLFVARHYTYLLTGSKEQAVQKIEELNGLFVKPLKSGEVYNRTISAIRYADTNDHLRLYNETLIEWFEITEAEMQHLSVLISKEEKQRRNRKAKEKSRRLAGGKSREEYNRRRSTKLLRLLTKLKLIRATYPKSTNTAVSKLLKVSKSYVTKLMKMLKEGVLDKLVQALKNKPKPAVESAITTTNEMTTNAVSKTKKPKSSAIMPFVSKEVLLEYQLNAAPRLHN